MEIKNGCRSLILVFLFYLGLEPYYCPVITKLQHDEQQVGSDPHWLSVVKQDALI